MTPNLRQIPALLLWLLLIWLVSPIFTAVNIEAYSARLQSMAAEFNGPGVLDYDRLMPLHVEYLYLTRSGVVFLLAGFNRLFGLVPDLGFKVITLLSFVIVVLASAKFARTWGAIRYRVSIPVLLMIPGVPEVAYYFNDNIVSAAFSAAAFALTAPKATWRGYAAVGVLMAAAISCRTDAALALPLLGLIACLPAPKDYRAILARWSGLVFGLATTLAAISWFGGFSFLDVISVARLFRTLSKYRGVINASNLIIYFGAAMGIVTFAGVVQIGAVLWRRRDFFRLLALVAAPLGMTIAIATFIGSNLRYGYPLMVPFWALYGGWAVRAGLAGWRANKIRLSVAVLFIGVTFSVTPPQKLYEQDGPQLIFGRLWEPLWWWEWERPIQESAARVDALITAQARSRLTVIITTHFNDDAYLRQHLIYTGFEQDYAEDVFPGCRGFFVFRKDGKTIVDVRTDDLYGLARAAFRPPPVVAKHEPPIALAALPLETALSCQAIHGPDAAYLTAYEKTDERLPSALYPELIFAGVAAQPIFQALTLSPAELDDLRKRAEAIAPTLVSSDHLPITYDRYMSAHELRYLQGNPHWPGQAPQLRGVP